MFLLHRNKRWNFSSANHHFSYLSKNLNWEGSESPVNPSHLAEKRTSQTHNEVIKLAIVQVINLLLANFNAAFLPSPPLVANDSRQLPTAWANIQARAPPVWLSFRLGGLDPTPAQRDEGTQPRDAERRMRSMWITRNRASEGYLSTSVFLMQCHVDRGCMCCARGVCSGHTNTRKVEIRSCRRSV